MLSILETGGDCNCLCMESNGNLLETPGFQKFPYCKELWKLECNSFLMWETWRKPEISMLFPSGFPKNSCGNLTIPRGFHYVSLRKPVISMWLPPIFHRGKPLVDPSFPTMEACKPERRVFPPRGKPHGKRYFPGWKPHGNVVNLWFPCGFPYVSPEGKSFFHPVIEKQLLFQSKQK